MNQAVTEINVSQLNGSNGFSIEANNFFDAFGLGWYASSAGDVNGDGYDDLMLAAPSFAYSYQESGKVYVVFGQAEGFGSSFDISTLNGNNGFVIDGLAPGYYDGYPVSSAGDINGDGIADMIIGDSSAGKSYVVFGKADGFSPTLDISQLDGSNGFVIQGASDLREVSSAGDINGDGYDDLIVADAYRGKSYVVFGKTGDFSATFDLSTLDGSNGFLISDSNKPNPRIQLVSSAGDVNGDGIADLIIGIGSQQYVVFGSASGFASSIDLATLYLDAFNLNLDLTAIPNNKITGIEQIDLVGTSNNSLILSSLNVLALSDTSNQLIVYGDVGNSVTSTDQGWIFDGITTLDGLEYNQYLQGAATLLVGTNITQIIS